MTNNCMICREPERARLIEADWAGRMSAKGIAARMTAAGWPVSPETVLSHLKKHVLNAATRQNVPAGVSRRDAATFIKDRILDEIELRETAYRIALTEAEGDEDATRRAMDMRPNILDKDLQPALGTALKAEGIVVKRETTNIKINLFQLMLGGGDGKGMLAPVALIGEGMNYPAIEGHFEDVSEESDADTT